MKTQNKKAQITIFVIIAIVIVGSITALLLSTNKIYKQPVPEELEITVSSGIREIAQKCIQVSLIDGTRILGFQGGFIRIPKKSAKTAFTEIAYGYYLGQKLYPTKEKMEEELAYYLDNAVPICFNENNKYNYRISAGKASTKIEISDEEVIAKVIYPISIAKETTVSNLKQDYEAKIPIGLGKIRDFGEGIINRTVAEPNYVPMSYLLHPVYNVSFAFTNNGEVIYTIIDNSSTIDKIPYTFLMATKTR